MLERIVSTAIECGAMRANVIDVKKIEFDTAFRDMCAANSCGLFGKCWMCPPDIGEINGLITRAKRYSHALVYQYVGELEDSFDFEGMVAAKRVHYRLSQDVRKALSDIPFSSVLHLGAGGCGVCGECAKRSGENCRFPELAMPSLEGYGINVSKLAAAAGMKYINGQNTVTYFGAVLFDL